MSYNSKTEPDLTVTLGRGEVAVTLANPVLTASGTCGYAFELGDFLDIAQLGCFVTKSITLEERPGNPPQRTFETAAGMLNAIGLANVGLERFCVEKIPLLERMPVPVFVNVAGKTIDEYVTVSKKVMEFSCISGLELNISCPNVKQGGLTFGTDPGLIRELVAAVRRECPQMLLIVKLTPNVTDICATARAAVEAGADVLSLINTYVGMAIDIDTQKPVLGNRTGGLSGPAIKPLAIHLVNRVYNEVARESTVPLIGLGGIGTARDAIEFLLAGASAVAVGTQLMIDPACITGILAGIRQYLTERGYQSVRELTGALKS